MWTLNQYTFILTQHKTWIWNIINIKYIEKGQDPAYYTFINLWQFWILPFPPPFLLSPFPPVYCLQLWMVSGYIISQPGLCSSLLISNLLYTTSRLTDSFPIFAYLIIITCGNLLCVLPKLYLSKPDFERKKWYNNC